MMRPNRSAQLRRVVIAALLSTGCDHTEPNEPAPGPLAATAKRAPVEPSSPYSSRTEDVTRALQGSVHAKLDCSECHSPKRGGQGSPKGSPTTQERATCEPCHRDQVAAHSTSVHARIEQTAATQAAVCAQCHGDHDIRRVSDPEAPVNKRNLSALCTACHLSPDAAPRLRAKAAEAGARYLESIHGRALVQKGLLVAPSCTDCHGKAHELRPPADPASPVARANVVEACGHCHEGVVQAYRTSVHAAAGAAGSVTAPVCPTCHTAHDITGATPDFRLASDRTCGRCHEKRRDQYLDTYHGRAHHLGDTRVAACYDCHGPHAIQKVTDPRSTLLGPNRVATCRKCHADATPSFAAFMPHADPTDRHKYPALFWTLLCMTGLLAGTFAFFGVHTTLWFSRSILAFAQDKENFREHRQKVRDERQARLFLRFRPIDRFCHLLIILSFLLLVATGMPLRFHDAPWARTIFAMIGGVQTAGRLHRLGAIVTFVYFALHLTSLVGPLRRRRGLYVDGNGRFRLRGFLAVVFGPDSPAPNLQDASDFWAHLKWFLGRGPRPTFDRFTYWEKFDYMAVFWGVSVIGLSGLVMWFPQATTRILPGWAINIAHVIHSDEALLAAGFIFTFHFFNSHFRPDKFPFDHVIFSGRITEAEMRHERGRQYERLQAEGGLDSLVTTGAEWTSWKWLLTPFGYVALLTGLSLVAAISWALASHLFR